LFCFVSLFVVLLLLQLLSYVYKSVCLSVEAIDSQSVLNVNITSCLLEQWSQTSRKWTEDYQKMPT